MERRNRRSKAAALDPHSNYVTDPNIVNKMFFAHQVSTNLYISTELTYETIIFIVLSLQDCSEFMCDTCVVKYFIKL